MEKQPRLKIIGIKTGIETISMPGNSEHPSDLHPLQGKHCLICNKPAIIMYERCLPPGTDRHEVNVWDTWDSLGLPYTRFWGPSCVEHKKEAWEWCVRKKNEKLSEFKRLLTQQQYQYIVSLDEQDRKSFFE